MKIKSKETYCREIEQRFNSQIDVLGEYQGNRILITHRCNKCGGEFDAAPFTMLRRANPCLLCGDDIYKRKGRNTGTRKKTNEQFVAELKARWGEKISPLTEYDGNKNKIRFKCNVCGNEFSARPNDLLSGWKRWCPICSNKIMGKNFQKTNEQYLKDLEEVHCGRITPLEKYSTNRNISILHRCNICGHEWKITPHNLLSGEGCPSCKKKTISGLKRKTQEQYESELKTASFDRIGLLGDYITNDTPTLHRCNICGHEWETTPHRLLSGHGCPKCNMSRGEAAIENFLANNKITYIHNKQVFDWLVYKEKMKPDFYLPDYNLVIEYNGQQHYEPVEHFNGEDGFKATQERDETKRKLLSEHNVDLVEIPYWEFDNIHEILFQLLVDKKQ